MPAFWPPRWPPHWPKPRLSLILAWIVALIFIGHWIFGYDECRARDPDGAHVACLAASFYAVLLTWLIAIIAIAVSIFERLSP